MDFMFSVAVVVLGFAATQPWDRARRVRLDGMRMLILPLVFAIGAFALVAYDHFAGSGPSPSRSRWRRSWASSRARA